MICRSFSPVIFLILIVIPNEQMVSVCSLQRSPNYRSSLSRPFSSIPRRRSSKHYSFHIQRSAQWIPLISYCLNELPVLSNVKSSNVGGSKSVGKGVVDWLFPEDGVGKEMVLLTRSCSVVTSSRTTRRLNQQQQRY